MNEEIRDLKGHFESLIDDLKSEIKILEYRVSELEKKEIEG